jgi:hypothetical protein
MSTMDKYSPNIKAVLNDYIYYFNKNARMDYLKKTVLVRQSEYNENLMRDLAALTVEISRKVFDENETLVN